MYRRFGEVTEKCRLMYVCVRFKGSLNLMNGQLFKEWFDLNSFSSVYDHRYRLRRKKTHVL